MWVTRLSTVECVYSKTQILLVTLRTQNQTRGESYILRKSNIRLHLFDVQGVNVSIPQFLQNQQLFRWMLGDVVREVSRSSKSAESPTHGTAGNFSQNHQSKPKQKENRDVDQLSHVDYVPNNAQLSQSESQLYISEDNEAVIKMIIKGSSPTMRHVSRTHRVALDRLFDRINLDPKIKYVDTRNQLGDMLTKSCFTRDEWDHLLRLLHMKFSMFSCSHFLSNRKRSVMSNRAQESTAKEGSEVAKPRLMNLVSRNLLSEDSSARTARGSKSWIRVMFHRASGNWFETATKTQQHIFKSGDKMTFSLRVWGNWFGVVNLQARGSLSTRKLVRKPGAARGEFFGATSRERQSGIWK